jgi:hypothetical protein
VNVVPQGLEHSVSEAQRHQVLDHLLRGRQTDAAISAAKHQGDDEQKRTANMH